MPAPQLLPAWFERLAFGVACAAAGLAISSTVLALTGLFYAGPVLILGTAAGYSLWAVWGPAAPGGSAHRAAGLVLVVALGGAVVNGVTATGRVVVDGDAAARSLAARELAATRDFEAEPGAVAVLQAGVESRAEGPRVVTAVAGAFAVAGDRPLAVVNAVFGLAATLGVALLVARFAAPWIAVLAAIVWSVIPAVFLGARDLVPEIAAAGFAVVAGWALLAARADHALNRAAVAGVFGGLAAATAPSGWPVVLGIAAWSGLEELRQRGRWVARWKVRRLGLSVAAGAGPPLGLWLVDAWRGGRLGPALSDVGWMVTGLVVIGGAFAAVRRVRWGRPGPGAGVAAAVVVTAGAGLLRRTWEAGAAATVVESPLAWLVTGGGAVLLAAGVVGWGWRAGVAWRSGDDPALPWLAMTAIAAALTVFRPGSDPLQYEAALAFLPAVVPALLVGAGWMLNRWWADPERQFRQTAALLLAAALIAVPGWYGRSLAGTGPQPGGHDAVAALCGLATGDDVVVVVAPEDAALAAMVPGLGLVCGWQVSRSATVPAAEADVLLAAAPGPEGAARFVEALTVRFASLERPAGRLPSGTVEVAVAVAVATPG